MKRTILFLAFLLTVVGVKAQNLTATLQQGDTMTPFYGIDAFKEAYNAAQDGAVITLSSGRFNSVDSITKQIAIIGNGCGEQSTYLYGKYYRIDNRAYTYYGASLYISTDNVKVEGIYAVGIILRNTSNVHISNCFIDWLVAAGTHKNTVIEQCFVNYDHALDKSENICYKNCVINHLENRNTASNMAYFINCFIMKHYDVCLVEEGKYMSEIYDAYGIFKNCMLGIRSYDYRDVDKTGYVNFWQGFNYSVRSTAPSEYYNNAFFLYPYKYVKNSSGNWVSEWCNELKTLKVYMGWMSDTEAQRNFSSSWSELVNYSSFLEYWYKWPKKDVPYKGIDGTIVGPYGGVGLSLYSSIPHIIESTIESDTDSNGKLSVKLKVSVNQ